VDIIGKGAIPLFYFQHPGVKADPFSFKKLLRFELAAGLPFFILI
jgi:hypothetical protein